jgi:hypothetical protein
MATLRDKSTKLTVARAPKYDKQQQNRPAIASKHVAVSNGVDDKSHSMSSAHVDIQINEDK